MNNILKIKVKSKRPLFWWVVKIFFPAAKWGQVAFTFGDTIYYKGVLDEALWVHESVHCKQHHYSKIFACYVFVRFVLSKRYRLKLEIPAYQAHWEVMKKHCSGWVLDAKRSQMAFHLAGPLYGSAIDYKEAKKLFL